MIPKLNLDSIANNANDKNSKAMSKIIMMQQ